MKKVYKFLLFNVLCFIGLSACSRVKLEHYKQHMYPVQGQFVGTSGIQYIFLDESKTSEMSNVANIKKIYITTETGDKKKVEDWTIEEVEWDISEVYTKRVLTLNIPKERDEFVISKVTIVYVDKTEEFEAGSLKVIPEEKMKQGVMSCDYVDVSHLYSTGEYVNDLLKGDSGNLLMLSGLSLVNLESAIKITQIDLGVSGIGIEPSTICLLEGDDAYKILGMSKREFALAEENAMYVQSSLVEELPEQTFELDITNNLYSMYMLVKVTDEYQADNSCVYITPVFSFKTSNSHSYIYGSSKWKEICEPVLQAEDEVKKILENNGI